VKPVIERHDNRLGRVQAKYVGQGYLLRKGGTESTRPPRAAVAVYNIHAQEDQAAGPPRPKSGWPST
jgi:hypothetical protein